MMKQSEEKMLKSYDLGGLRWERSETPSTEPEGSICYRNRTWGITAVWEPQKQPSVDVFLASLARYSEEYVASMARAGLTDEALGELITSVCQDITESN